VFCSGAPSGAATRRTIATLGALLLAICHAPELNAQPRCSLPVLAYVSDDAGVALEGSLLVELRFYLDGSADAEAAECRSFPAATVNAGWIHVVVDACATPDVGDCGTVALNQFLDDGSADLWVGVVVGGEELEPRISLGSVPYAIRAHEAGDATTLQGLAPDAFVPAGDLLAHAGDPEGHHPSSSDGLDITPDTVLVRDGIVDFGPDADDELNAEMVRTLTGGGDADALHSHASSGVGGGCMNVWGRTDCPDGFTLFFVGDAIQPLARERVSGAWDLTVGVSDLICVDPTTLPPSRVYRTSDFHIGLLQAGGPNIHEGDEALGCAVCCR
jgi:hypothetical protein